MIQLEREAQISGIQLTGGELVAHLRTSTESLSELLAVSLKCRAPAGSRLSIETSLDLRAWRPAAAVSEELAPGEFRLTMMLPAQGHEFFRLKVSGSSTFEADVLPGQEVLAGAPGRRDPQ